VNVAGGGRTDPGEGAMDPAAAEGRSEIWIRALRERPGSDTVWGVLHERYRRRILVYAHYRLGPELRRYADAEDVVNEAWMRIVTAWDRFEYRGPDSLFHWLCLQVRRVILDRRRKLDRQSVGEDEREPALPADVLDVPESAAGPRTEVMQRDLRDRLTAALESVPELYRRVLVEVLLEGRPPAEVAEEQGMKIDTVRKQVARGMDHWRNALGGDPMRYL
jgi:RNA polymerase sigma factor (sigma-70 family)